MKLVTRDLGDTPGDQNLLLMPISDLHIGHPRHHPVVAQRIVNWIRGGKNRYTILVGDMTETALRDSYGDVYEQPISPQKQAEEVVRLLTPIKTRILGCVSGNHEARVTMRTSFDPSMIYASALNVPYDPGSMVLAITWAGYPTKRRGAGGKSVGKRYFTLYFTHGWGAARTLGPRLQQPRLLRDVVSNADVYITAHNHQPGEFPLDHFEIDLAHKQIARRTQRFVTLGSSLDHAEYAEAKGLAPTTMEFPIIELVRYNGTSDHRKKIIVHSSAHDLDDAA